MHPGSAPGDWIRLTWSNATMPATLSSPTPGRAGVIQGFFKGGRPALSIQAHPGAGPGVPGRAPVAQPFSNGHAFRLPSTVSFGACGNGQPLPAAVLGKMEDVFGTSFADVRVYVGPQAASIGAVAFTMGFALYFAPGQYDPHGMHGQRLLAHERTHVVQQRAGRVRNPLGGGVAVVQDPALEAEAERMGVRVGTLPFSPGAPVRAPILPGAAQADVAQPALGWGLVGAVVSGGVAGLATGGLGWVALGAALVGGYAAHRRPARPTPLHRTAA
jgi:hypothetical protein